MARRLADLLLVVVASASCAQLTATSAAAPADPKLMVFGGRGHRVYLGCLTCSEFAPESVFNQYGRHGASTATSVLNETSPYGSRTSDYSACNPQASDPPVIKDQRGKYYGRLTVKRNGDQPPTGGLRTWIARVCGG